MPGPRSRARWSLRRRVLVESLAILLLVIALGLAIFSVALDRILTGVAEADAHGQVDEMSELVADGDLTPERMSEEVASHGSIMQILASDGHVLQASPTSTRSQPLTTLRPHVGATATERVEGVPAAAPQHWLVVARGVLPAAGGPVHSPVVVLVAAPLSAASATMRMTLWWFAGTGAVLLLVGGILQWRGISAALEPVRRITREVDDIHHARSDQRVTEPRTDDEIAQLADVMNQMLDRLDRADASTRRFISDASHELRSPLTTIRAVLEGEASPAGTRAHERDLVIHTEVLRMQRLVEDLLTLAKSDDAGLQIARDEVDLDEIVAREVTRLRATTAASPLSVRARIEAARILGDEHRLAQALRNLTDNAARHAAGIVAVGLWVDGDVAVLTVDNDGDPIPPQERLAVFERFVRLSSARERDAATRSGGSGLGLAIAAALVERHGGTITALDPPAHDSPAPDPTASDSLSPDPTGARAGWTGTGCRIEVRLPVAPDYVDVPRPADTPPGSPTGTIR